MRGIRLSFGPTGPRFDFRDVVKDFDCTVQNALVNVGTDTGSDPFFAARGTDLKRDGAAGRMATTIWANHSANFAALRTLSFIQQTDVESNPFKLQSFNLQCESITLATAILDVQAISIDGTTVGGLANV